MSDERINSGFWDLPPEDRAVTYEQAREDTGMDFFDLSPEERVRYYERANPYDDP
jgi:hypothetical protein